MKKLLMILCLSALFLGVRAMPFGDAQRHALFLSDKMAYELGLTAGQYDAVYQVNLDYFLSVDPGDVYGSFWRLRNREMRAILNAGQYLEYERAYRFYRPIHWKDGMWHFGVYGYYTDRTLMYRGRPSVYHGYRGGRYFGPRPAPGPRPRVTPGPPPRRAVPGPAPRPGYRQGPAPRRDGFRSTPAPRPGYREAPRTAPRPGYRQGPTPRRDSYRSAPAPRANGFRQGSAPAQRNNNFRQGPTQRNNGNNFRQAPTQRNNGNNFRQGPANRNNNNRDQRRSRW